MSRSDLAAAGVALLAVAAPLLLVLVTPRDWAPPGSVRAGGVTLATVSIALPADDVALPPGPHRDAVDANCTGCHSPAMIVSQPRLTRAQWQAEVEKMQTAYHAPVDPAAVPVIMDYLSNMTGG